MAKKQKKPMFETMVFDDYAAAKKVADKAKIKNILSWIGMAFAVVSTYLAIMLFKTGETGYIAGIFLSLVAYVLAGGLGRALKFAGRLALFGWIHFFFPISIFAGLIGFVLGVYCLLFFPVLFVFMSFIQHNRDAKAANDYLKCYSKAEVE